MRFPRLRRSGSGPVPSMPDADDPATVGRRFELSVERRARRLGAALGRAGVASQEVLRPDGAGPRYVRGLVGARQKLGRHAKEVQIARAARRVAGIEGRTEAASSRKPHLRER